MISDRATMQCSAVRAIACTYQATPRVLRRLFQQRTAAAHMQIVTECQSIFNFRLPSVIIPDRCETFRVKQATSLAITRYTSFPCPRCKICCICNLNALFTVYFVSYVRLTILHIDCILVFIVYCSLFVFFSISLADEYSCSLLCDFSLFRSP